MAFSVTTWNINSVRLLMPLVQHFLETEQPDVLCLQETKCPNDAFPSAAFRKLGYEHIAIHGQKGYHGVAIVSRLPLSDDRRQTYCDIDHTRNISAVVEAPGSRRIRIHNFYVPAGGDEPNREINEKFAHKLDFIEEMKCLNADADQADGISSILVGDLNIAPLETDVWSHKQLLKVVSHTPVEVEQFAQTQDAGNWVDITRQDIPDGLLYSWWSYRAKDWSAADKGRRLDHVWATQDISNAGHSSHVLRDARGWEKPSDHAPVFASFDL